MNLSTCHKLTFIVWLLQFISLNTTTAPDDALGSEMIPCSFSKWGRWCRKPCASTLFADRWCKRCFSTSCWTKWKVVNRSLKKCVFCGYPVAKYQCLQLQVLLRIVHPCICSKCLDQSCCMNPETVRWLATSRCKKAGTSSVEETIWSRLGGSSCCEATM